MKSLPPPPGLNSLVAATSQATETTAVFNFGNGPRLHPNDHIPKRPVSELGPFLLSPKESFGSGREAMVWGGEGQE